MGPAILILTVLVLLFSYRYYVSRKVSQNVKPSWSRSTPARRYMDGVNFLPTPTGMLTGFQFKSISLDVIIGPVIAVQFGWLPAILWLLIGAIFFGWVQDYFSAIMSMRKEGSPLGDLIGSYFTPSSRLAILVFIYMYLLIILGQFGLLFSTLLGRENVSIGILFLILAGFLAGLMIYRWRINLILATLLSVLIALIGLWATSFSPLQSMVIALNQTLVNQGSLNLPGTINSGGISWLSLIWLLILFAICYLGAILPIWRFAVPFNYVSAWVIILGIGLAVVGLFFGTLNGSIDAGFEIPPLVSTFQPNLGPLWPILFVTLSSGAVSGWHSLVSSFSTARQIEKEPNAMVVTSGAMFGETVMGAIVIIFAASFGVSSGAFSSEQNFSLIAGPASVFAAGLTKSWNAIGFSEIIGGSFSAIFFTLMGLSVIHLILRFAGMVSADLFSKRLSFLDKPKLSILLVIFLAIILILFGFWQSLWVLFAGANQLLAAIVLLLASTWLGKQGKSYWWILSPSVLLFVTAMAALFYSAVIQAFYQQIVLNPEITTNAIFGNLVTIIFGLFFMITGSYLFFVGCLQFNRVRANRNQLT